MINVIDFYFKKWPKKIPNNHKIIHFILFYFIFWVIFFKKILQVAKIRQPRKEKRKKEKEKTTLVEITEKPKHARTPPTCNRARLPTSFTRPSVRPSDRMTVRPTERPSVRPVTGALLELAIPHSLVPLRDPFQSFSCRCDFWLAASAVELVCVCVCLSLCGPLYVRYLRQHTWPL